MNFDKLNRLNWKFPRLVLALAASIYLLVHLLWFAQTPVWYPLRCFLNGLPITIFFFIPALF